MDLDQLDAEKLGPFTVMVNGEARVVPPAADLPWKAVAACASSPHWFAILAWPPDVQLKAWQIEDAQHAWCRHNGLPAPEQIRRLTFMVERYYEGLEYDLRTKVGVSLGELWRARRWRELLNYIDLLPPNTHKNRLMLNDEEYVEQLLGASDTSSGDNRPSLADFSPEVAAIVKLTDAVNRNTMVTHGVAQGTKGKMDLRPEPRPATAIDKIRYQKEKKAHEELTAILTPGRR